VRNLVNAIVFFLRLHLFLMQNWYFWTDKKHLWLRRANSIFHQMHSIYASEKIIRSVKRSYQLFCIITGVFFVTVLVGAVGGNYFQGLPPNFSIISVSVFYTFHVYYSGLFTC